MDKERRNRNCYEDDGLLFLKPNSTGERNKSGTWKIAAIALLFIGVILLVVGLCLYFTSNEIVGNKMEMEYTNCTSDIYVDIKCSDRVKMGKSCVCLLQFELTKSFEGPIFLYYKTPDIRTSEHYKDSRDDNQLAGNLSSLSASCGDFRTDEDGKPIAPCGEVADSYLEDTYDIFSKEYLPLIETGLNGITEEDKKQYRNPPHTGELKTVFKDFAKPKSWTKNIWELDESNSENNGFQNEKFIGWMKQDLTLKPALRLNDTNIPAGNYTFKIGYRKYEYVPDTIDDDMTQCDSQESLDMADSQRWDSMAVNIGDKETTTERDTQTTSSSFSSSSTQTNFTAIDEEKNTLANNAFGALVGHELELSKYVNRRILVLSSEREVVDKSCLSAGIALIIIGVLVLVGFLFTLGCMLFKRVINIGG